MNSSASHRRHHPTTSRNARYGYTLMEMVASVAATTILVAGMGSVVMVAARSTSESTVPALQIQASTALHEIASELQFAIAFTERTATAVEFTVADRDADAAVETIRYAWSGTPGDPLTRQYNGAAVVDYLANVHAFDYTDLVRTVTFCDGTETHHVYQCDLALQAGPDSSARITSTLKTFNAPEVATP